MYQTVLASGLIAKPMQIDVPSFHQHSYENRGFLLASERIITKSELETISLPSNLRAIAWEHLIQSFVFKRAIAQYRHSVMIHTLNNPKLFYYLLNPISSPEFVESNTEINFLNIQEVGTEKVGRDLLQFESAAQFWIEQVYSSQNPNNLPNNTQLLPAQHRYHNPKMTTTWLTHLKELLVEVDISRLLSNLLARAQELPPQITRDLKQLSDKICFGQPLTNLSPKASEFIMLLSFTLLMALVTPDVLFAKGFRSRGGGYSTDGDYNSSDSDLKILGFVLAVVGGIWMKELLTNLDKTG